MASSSASAPPLPSHSCSLRTAISCRTPSSFPGIVSRLSCALIFTRAIVFAPSRTGPSTRIRAIHSLDPDFYKIPYVDGVPVGKKLKLWNLPPNCKHSELLEWFQGVNITVESLELTDDPKLNAQGIGGFVELATKQDACIAIIRLDGAKFRGHYIRLDFAEKKPHSRDYGSRRNRSNNSSRSRQLHDSRSNFQANSEANHFPSTSSSLRSRVADEHIPVSSYVKDIRSQSRQSYTNFGSNEHSIQNHTDHGYGDDSNIGNRQTRVEALMTLNGETSPNHVNAVPPTPSSHSALTFASASDNNSYSMAASISDLETSASEISQGITKDAVKQEKPGPGYESPHSNDRFRNEISAENHNVNNPANSNQGHRETDYIQTYGSSNITRVQDFHKFRPMYGSPRPSSLFRIFVGNLDLTVDDASLQQLFSKYGTVLEARVLKEGGRSRGLAVIAMSSAEEVESATLGLDGQIVLGLNMKVASVVP